MAYQKINAIERKIPEWIEKGFTRKDDIDLIEHFGKYIAGKLNKRDKQISTSQIRIAYGEVTRLKMSFDESSISSLMMIRPKIAYAAAREGGQTYRDLQKVIAAGINAVSVSSNKQVAFNNFANLFEAILAYHKAYEKAYGGK